MGLDILQSVWPEWHIEEKIGEGSYGKVYKASRECMGYTSYCAIKVLTIPQSDDELESVRLEGMDQTASRTYFQEIVRDLINEIKIMESLKGTQNIVSIEDFKVIEEENGVRWVILIRMELLTPLNRYLSDRSLQEPDVLKLGIDICDALELCSQRGIIHRDIKPENIFISDLGYFKLGDFGIGKQLEKTVSAQTRKGTVNYMAPEVNNGGSYDSRADMYSLGLVLYKLMNNNRMPFVDAYKQLIPYREKIDANMRRLSGEPLPDPANAGKAFASVIQKACAYHMDDRYRNVTELKEDMQRLLIKSMSKNASVFNEPAALETENIASPNKSRDNYENTTIPPEYDGSVLRRDSARPSTFTNEPYTRPQHSKKRKTFLTVMLGIAALLLCGVVGVYLFLEYNNNKQEDDPFDVISQAKPGDIVTLGNYEQNSIVTDGKEPIEWIVIKSDDEKMMLLSKMCLDCKKYDDKTKEGGSITWEHSSIRAWLNSEFYESAFGSEEEKHIILSEVDNSENKSENDGKKTLDKIFLLSISEAEQLTYEQRQANATEYAIDNGSEIGDDQKHYCWWLRSPGDASFRAAEVYSNGNIDYEGDAVYAQGASVRPAIWINKKSNYTYPVFESVTSQNNHKAEYGYNYIDKNVLDHDLATCWIEGDDEAETGSWVELQSSKPQQVNGLIIYNGIYSPENDFYKNQRIKDVEIVFNNNEKMTFTLKGEYDEQPNRIDFEEPVETTTIRIKIISIYESTKYKDTCISEVIPY